MSKKVLSVLITIIAILSMVGSAFAATAGLPGSGWWTGEIIQNVGTVASEITVTAYDKNSTTTYQYKKMINPGENYVFMPGDFSGMGAGFEGSAVVTASEPIKAVVNITNRYVPPLGIEGGKAAAQYQGVDGTMIAQTIYFPVVKGDASGKTTTFYVQNAGTAQTVITGAFKMRNGDTHTYTSPNVEPNRMIAFQVIDAPTWVTPANNDGKVGSLTVTANQPLAGTVVEHFTTEVIATVAQATRAMTSADFDSTLYAPLVKKARGGKFTGLNIQNVENATNNVTITFVGTAGACNGQTYTQNVTIDPLSPKTVVQMDPSPLPDNCAASAKIVGSGNLLAVVNESYLSTAIPASGQNQTAYFAIPANSATAKLVAPVFKDDRAFKRTGLTVQNVGSADATNVVATFSCKGAATFTAITKPLTITKGGRYLFYHPYGDQYTIFTTANPFASENVSCGVTITADQPIVAVVNESVPAKFAANLEQDANNYEGFNLTP